jgi:hypothetical protein
MGLCKFVVVALLAPDVEGGPTELRVGYAAVFPTDYRFIKQWLRISGRSEDPYDRCPAVNVRLDCLPAGE